MDDGGFGMVPERHRAPRTRGQRRVGRFPYNMHAFVQFYSSMRCVCVSSQDTLFLAFVSVCFFPLLSSAEAVLALLLYGVRSCYFLKHMLEVVRT